MRVIIEVFKRKKPVTTHARTGTGRPTPLSLYPKKRVERSNSIRRRKLKNEKNKLTRPEILINARACTRILKNYGNRIVSRRRIIFFYTFFLIRPKRIKNIFTYVFFYIFCLRIKYNTGNQPETALSTLIRIVSEQSVRVL